MAKRALAVLMGMFACFAVNAQSVLFPNSNPGDLQIELQDGSTIGTDANGNFSVRCDPADPAGCPRLAQGGGGSQCGIGATFTAGLAVVDPTSPGAPGPYPAGSQLTLRAGISGATVCVGSATQGGGGVGVSGWTGVLPIVDNAVTRTVTLPSQGGAAYILRLTCFGATGSVVSDRAVNTSNVIVPPPSACPSQYPASTIYTNTAAGVSTYTALGGTTGIRNIGGFPELFNQWGNPLNDFPQTGTSGILEDNPLTARVVRIRVPSPFIQPNQRRFVFMGQPNGFNQASDAYISLSTCPGDFRIPTATQSGTSEDPTFADACRNWRGVAWSSQSGLGDIFYDIGAQSQVSTPTSCVLVPGREYYLNILMVKPGSNRRLPPLINDSSTVCWRPELGSFMCGHFMNAGG